MVTTVEIQLSLTHVMRNMETALMDNPTFGPRTFALPASMLVSRARWRMALSRLTRMTSLHATVYVMASCMDLPLTSAFPVMTTTRIVLMVIWSLESLLPSTGNGMVLSRITVMMVLGNFNWMFQAMRVGSGGMRMAVIHLVPRRNTCPLIPALVTQHSFKVPRQDILDTTTSRMSQLSWTVPMACFRQNSLQTTTFTKESKTSQVKSTSAMLVSTLFAQISALSLMMMVMSSEL
mmetsp:Transcript_15139/g.41857  ORF Transcript_15139/g.41857 Transcript_15139/m.41857 type:complete len:235 (-) Transcript_15139:2125-2829(-)